MNDEARVLEQSLPDVPHLQGPDRAHLATIAVDELESEVVVLDDGFQHRRLARDVEIVLLDALEPFGLGRIFPRGLLREPIGSLRRADVVVITRADLASREAIRAIRERAERAAGRTLAWVHARHAPRELVTWEGSSESLDSLRGRRVAAFCGIGNPEGFRRTLGSLGATLASFRTYPDHHPYDAGDVSDLAAWARDEGADLVLTTRKDLVKLRVATLGSIPLRALDIALEVIEGDTVLVRALGTVMPHGRAV